MFFNPPHPGELLREDCIEATGLSISEAAKKIGVDTEELVRVMNSMAPIDNEIAESLEKVGWSSAAHWLRMQDVFDKSPAQTNFRQLVSECGLTRDESRACAMVILERRSIGLSSCYSGIKEEAIALLVESLKPQVRKSSVLSRFVEDPNAF